jgi:signal transduction histidine kinase
MVVLPPVENPTAGELSTRALMSLVVYFGKNYGQERLRASIKRANLGRKVDLDYFLNENNWVSFAAGQRLIDVLDEDADEPDFTIQSGLITATRESVGFVFSAFRAFGDPKACYIQLFKTLPLYNRVGKFTILDLKKNYLRFSYDSSVIEPNLRFSRHRMYQFASFPTLWGLPPADVKLIQHHIVGERQLFEYELRWATPPSRMAIIFWVFGGASVAGLACLGFDLTSILPEILIGGGIGGVGGVVVEQRRMLKERDNMLKEQAVDIIQSINALQARYDELQALNVSLEQKVEARTSELKAANERLQELDKLKDRFLANISHELRTPLVALSSTLQLITRQQAVAEPQGQQALLASSQDSLDDMLENVNDLLLKTRSEKAMLEMRWSRVEIGAFVQSLVRTFEGMAQKSGITLRFDNCLGRPVQLYVDRGKLKKILNNLLGNALKFAAGEVAVTLISDGSRYLQLSVRDDGRGIPENEQEAIFKPFFQASNNPYRDVQGTGIGLSLVSDLVRMHHGEIQVSSRLGQGSRFTVSLPLGEAHVDWEHMEEEENWSFSAAPLQRGLRRFEELDLAPFSQHQPGRSMILLVEDNPHIVQVLAHILHPHYNLLFAGDGQDGLEQARAKRPDLIISDIMMPRLDGFGLLRAVRAEPALKNISLILLTSKADYASRLCGFEEGADEYLAKPFDNEELLVRVKGLLGRRYFQAELFHLNKIIAVGQLAAGVAHEINNPLAYVHSAAVSVGKIFESMHDGSVRKERAMQMLEGVAERIQEGTERIAAITDALRGFVRSGSAGFQPYDVREGLEATLKIIHANYKGQIRFRCLYDLEEKIECNITQFNQVLMNLLQNAVQAVADQQEQQITIATFRQGDMAHIHIQDNGPGIAKAHWERIFEPFFTTKPLGQGMGLGLHISRQIVQEHGGTLELENREGEGVLCKISLPIQQKGEAYEPVRYTHASVEQRLEGTRYPHR